MHRQQSNSPSKKNNFFKISSSISSHKRVAPLHPSLTANQSKTSQSQLNLFLKKIKSVNHQVIKNSALNLDNQVADFTADKKGIEITQKQIEDCFRLLDPKQNGQKITLHELSKKITQMNPNFPASEVGQLTSNKAELKANELFEMLKNNQIHDYDPMDEAFKLLEDAEHNLDFDKLANFFKLFNLGTLDKKEIGMLQQVLDMNNDGQVNLGDMKDIFDLERQEVLDIIKKQLD